ncbi:MAG TPA: T9SS type A sorting domain-containing protein [Flavobacteriales bacterium]|nr:T9SS type A sorting domain-containing protein [Flavobacteriales bacterium]
MKARLLLPLIVAASVQQVNAQQVTIIESQSGNSWAIQDSIWNVVATNMGFSSSIVPQSTLDAVDNLIGTDILVVSSGTISFSGTNHVQTIIDFVQTGRPAYIQAEYQTYYQGSATFAELMTALGSDFHWTGTVSGSLVPMTVVGDLASTPNIVTELGYYNYGLAGAGSDVEVFLEFNNQSFGFYRPATDVVAGLSGCVISQSDEDWVWNNASQALMGNMLAKLNSCATTTALSQGNDMPEVVVNSLFDQELGITNKGGETLALRLYSADGKLMLNNSFIGSAAFNTSALPCGLYVYELRSASGFVRRGKVLKTN